jgi:hypothetical protein
MSRYGIDPPDDDAYDVQYDGTDCADCGAPSVAWLCETCSDRRESPGRQPRRSGWPRASSRWRSCLYI